MSIYDLLKWEWPELSRVYIRPMEHGMEKQATGTICESLDHSLCHTILMVGIDIAGVNCLLCCRNAFLEDASIESTVVCPVMVYCYSMGCSILTKAMFRLNSFSSTCAELICHKNKFRALVHKDTSNVYFSCSVMPFGTGMRPLTGE